MAEPKIVKNIHIQQWNGDENYWSTQKPLMEGEIGIVNRTNSKTISALIVGDGSTNVENLLLNDSAFYPGIGAGYILPTASSTVHGGLKISDNYFYIDQGLLKPKTLQLIEDDNPDNPDEFNKANKSDNDAFISSPATDWKLRGDFYAETLYADEARIKNIIYDQETNISYLSKHLDIHKELFGDEGKREFTIQLTPDHYYWKYGEPRPEDVRAGYKYDVNIEGYLYIPEQTINVCTNTPEEYSSGYVGMHSTHPVSKNEDYNSLFPVAGSTWVTFKLESPDYVCAIDNIGIKGGWGSGGNSGGTASNTIVIDDPTKIEFIRSNFENNKYYTTITFLYPKEDWVSFEYLTVDYYKCAKKTYTIPESLLSSGSKLSIDIDEEWYKLDISWVDNVLTIDTPANIDVYNGYASENILTLYDDKTVVDVLKDDERAGIKIYNYHKDDQSVSKEKRKIAELSIDNQGILAYASDNSDLTNFSDVLTVNRYLANIDGFIWLSSTPAQPIKLTYYNKIPVDKIDLTSFPKLNMFLNQNNIGTYDPSNTMEQNIAINACSGIVANGTTYSVQEDGLITLADSTWTNELNNLLSTAVQQITFDNVEFLGPTITLKSKIQKITLDGLEATIGEDGDVNLKSKIQSITYDGVKHEESDIVIYTTSIKGLTTIKGSGTDERQYNTINITEDPATRTYWLSHYDTNTINEPVGTDTNIIGESGSKTSFNLMSNLSYDHYGHAEKYSSYTLDFSGLIARIEELEAKVAELEEQLKAS